MTWYRYGTWMTRLRTPLGMSVVILAGHLLSASWALWLVAFLYGITSLSLNSATVKAQAAHQRIDALVPQVGTALTTATNAMPKSGGTFTGSVTTQDHHVNGTLFGAGGTLTVGDNTHISGSAMTADGAITGHSTIAADGALSGASIHTGGVGEFDSGMQVGGSSVISSGKAFSGASIHVTTGVYDGDVSVNSFNGHSVPDSAVSNSDGTLGSTASAVNGVLARLRDVGIIHT